MQNQWTSRQVRGRPVLGMFAAGLLSMATVACASDRPQDYRFEVVNQPVAVGAHSELDVKLTDASTGQPVTNATITHAALGMTMPGFGHKPSRAGGGKRRMGGETEFVGMPAPGLYRFRGDVSMSGTWTLGLTAKVPGEPAPIDASVSFEAGR